MSRDCSKLSRRNSGKNLKFEEIENMPVNVSSIREPSVNRMSIDYQSRAPLNTIQDPVQNPSKFDYELGLKSSKVYRTPTKPKVKYTESAMKTPEKQGGLGRNRYGWGQDSRDEGRIGNGNTPKACKITRAASCFTEGNSTHTTPTKSVGKPPSVGLVYGGSSRPPVNGGVRTGNFTALSKGIPVAFNACAPVNTVDVPHFDLREDPSFWMDHNVQVLIRIRPLNGMEISSQGYSRCLKQESAQSLTWVAQPEARFTFDHVACETIDQEALFKTVGQPMVENCLSGYNSCMFAYGQTGSGKTHTMLGEVNDLEIKPSPNRGMTPRIFEFLFARIIAEEESRKDERLEYNCKCSFLEIYNEQITDLLDPSSTNLQLREDVKKGVYVENLTEYEVHCVGDILKLLSQGSANRRVAATNMNRESSRSHSVFTCVIESRWEKDSTSNLRFARLNLVDLAGSERQKTSGAEGERLKEAANINKSLSTLGHVIMVLVDGANSRTRHVPYRDSRLTFLLQDSLGGNSKTMIIANVSPSISSATETLNTLKFAQRAKLIQNNAVINEDASGDVVALQHQIRLLKEELAILKRQNTSRSLTFSSKDENCSNASSYGDDDKVLRVSCNQLKSLESSLNGALRREKSTENCIKQLEAEIEQLNCLVRQREEENRCTKMMLKFREDKIQKMESVFSGMISADSYLIEENNTLTEEIKILRAKVDKNPEVTRFAVENIRLLEQLKRFQDFYKEGEREMLMAEVSELRDQLALLLDEHNHMNLSTEKEAAEDKKRIDSLQSEVLIKNQEELEKCRDNLNSCLEKNAKLCRDISDLNALLERQKSSLNDQDGDVEVSKESVSKCSSIEDTVQEKEEIFRKYPEEIVSLHLELEFLKSILEEERLIHRETGEKVSSITKAYETSILKQNETRQELTLLREKCEEKDRNFDGLSEEFDFLTKKMEEVLTVGHNALDDASNFIGHGKETRVFENLQTIARKISEKELRIDELNTCLEYAKVRGNEMEIMLRSLRGAILVMSEAHQKDCVRKDEEIDRLLSELNEKNSLIILMEEQRKLYEVELMDAKTNAAQQDVESCCYLDKFAEIQDNIKEANLMINKLVSENEAMKMEISHQNEVINDKDEKLRCSEAAKNIDLENEKVHMSNVFEKIKEELIISYVDMQLKDWILLEKDAEVGLLLEEKELYEVQLMDAMKNATQQALESCCYLDKFEETQHQIKEADYMINKLVNENEATKIEINELKDSNSVIEKQVEEKDEELRCLEEKLVTDLSAKDIELFMMSSILEQVASKYNDFETDKVRMSKVFERFKEEAIVSYVDLHFENFILLEKYTENNDAELRLHKEENEKLVKVIKSQKDEVEGFDACFETLEYERHENIVKSVVLEAYLTEIFEDALNAKRSAEEQLAKTEFDRNNLIESLKRDLESVTCERDDLHAELRLHKEENEKLVKIIKNQKDEVERFDACFEALEYERQENIVKSVVLEAHLIENIEDALNAKRSVEEQLAKTAFDRNNLIESLKRDLESVTCERDDLHAEFLKAKQFYEVQLLDAMKNTTQQAVESCCYLDKFEETQRKIKEADYMINKLVNENEAMKIEINELKDSYSVLEKQLNEKHEDLRSLEERLVTDLSAKDMELFMMSSKLEHVASENYDLEKDKVNMSNVFDKFKEEAIISYVEKYTETCILQNEVDMRDEDLKLQLENKGAEIRLHKEENEKLVKIIENQKDEVEGFYAFFESLEYERHENIVKSVVLEAQLTENIEDGNNLIESLKRDLENVTRERDDLHAEFLNAKQLYETELKEADLTINKLVTENEAMETGIIHLNEVINAKEIELFIALSRLEQVASDNNDLEVEKVNVYSGFEKFKEETTISYLDLQMACETRKYYEDEKLKLYEKSVEELESTVNLLENQVDRVRGDAESQRLKKEELEQEVQEIHQQKELLIAENETFKIENVDYKIKLIELEDEVNKLLIQQDLQQHILPLAKITEENNMLKARNDENNDTLRKAEALVALVKEDLANYRASKSLLTAQTPASSH
ncbi:putative plus-end-directed kinesin ATPase [Helianthus annuus]|nr:putative plus-end-directed kinesin ATPase [Helianthus annuus]